MTESIEHDRRQPPWVKATCGTCIFRIGLVCRVMPPTHYARGQALPMYSRVDGTTPACAMYQHDRRGTPT